MKKPKPIKFVYVAGPLSQGDLMINTANAIRVGDQLKALGMVPFIPHLSVLAHLVSPCPYEGWMEQDFAWLEKCDAVLRMAGKSPGADREVKHAMDLRIRVFGGPGMHGVETSTEAAIALLRAAQLRGKAQ